MREVNFSIPNVNKASVGITTALYDRRALDCTSTLPLINSLNHLAYLTTSSARIRDILTVDGGVERLVCILKEGRSRAMMEMWKWNLAFQCVVNIGVRGSENVRTRVVEADMVPVIATILDNYIQVIDRLKEKAEAEAERRSLTKHGALSRCLPRCKESAERQNFGSDRSGNSAAHRSVRRQAPPPSIEIPQPLPRRSQQHQASDSAMDVSPIQAPSTINSPLDRATFSHQHHHHHHHHNPHHRNHDLRHTATRRGLPSAAGIPIDGAEGLGLQPVRDVDRLPSMLPSIPNGITSQPESPTTPDVPLSRPPALSPRARRRPSLRQQQSGLRDMDDDVSLPSETTVVTEGEPMVDIQTEIDIEGGEEREVILDAVATPLDLTAPPGSEAPEAETFNITHQPLHDGSIINTNLRPSTNTNMTIGQQVPQPPPHTLNAMPPSASHHSHGRYVLSASAPPAILAAMPRDEDVLMSLQLLAYVSKYCNLRAYFQNSHLVPKLKLGRSIAMLDDETVDEGLVADESEEEEYLLPDDFNIFPLVEKFTVRHHSQEMQYWAGVVMRNLCRKDDSRGGIRQCAYYKCGKWEAFTRQFAKCRRCRRTKYCSKECQKNAWVYHRHWCQVATT